MQKIRIALVIIAALMMSIAAVNAQERTVVDVVIGSDTNIFDWYSNSVKPAF